LIVNIHTVERDVALIAPCPIHRSIARVLVLEDGTIVDIPARICDSRLQTQQIRHVSAFQRNLAHLLFIEGIADRSVDQIQSRGFRCDRHDFGGRANFEPNVGRGRCVDQQLDTFLFIAAKPGRRYVQGVGPGRDKKELVFSLRPGGRSTFRLGVGIRQHNVGPNYGVVDGIGDRASERSGSLSHGDTATNHVNEERQS